METKYKEMLFRLEIDWQNYIENKGKLTFEDMKLIKWLVNKETPMKPLYIKKSCGFFENEYLIGRCPKCNTSVNQTNTYCNDCGQRLNWGE